eukprot:901525-Rhodomonas_salina.2
MKVSNAPHEIHDNARAAGMGKEVTHGKEELGSVTDQVGALEQEKEDEQGKTPYVSSHASTGAAAIACASIVCAISIGIASLQPITEVFGLRRTTYYYYY